MHARVIHISVPPNKVDEAIRLFRDSVIPAAKRQQGFQRATLLVERLTGNLQAISLWETEADARATDEGSAYLQEQFAKFASGTDVSFPLTVYPDYLQEQFARFISLFTTPPVVTHFEVAVDE